MASQLHLSDGETASGNPESLKLAALGYAARGWAVFPLHTPVTGGCSCRRDGCSDVGKHPRTEHGFKDATTDCNTISFWWGKWPQANLGVVTGLTSRLVVVDVDKKSGGLETMADWMDINGPIHTRTVATGGGGTHYYFQADGQKFETNCGKVGPGIDVRGEGGYIVVPPSLHESGERYEWESNDSITLVPDWLAAKIRDAEKRPNIPAPQSDGSISEGSRNARLTQLAGAARRVGASEAGINSMLQQENSGRCKPPLDEDEVAKIAHSIARYDPASFPLSDSEPVTPPDDQDWDVKHAFPMGDGKSLNFRAADIRRERTGVYAKVEVALDKALLGFSVLNTDRARERHEFAGACSKRLSAMSGSTPTAEPLATCMDNFCRNLFRASIRDVAAEIGGDPSIPVVMAVGDYIIEGGGTIMFAPPGRGKSFIALLMAISADAGVSKVWPVPRPQRSIYINLERSPQSIARRLGQCNIALGLEPDRPLLVLNARGKSLTDVRHAVESAVKSCGVEILFLDSISRSGQGSLLGDQETNKTIDMLNNLCSTWLAVGHTPRSDETHVFGSVHFEAGADLVVRLAAESGESRLEVGLKVVKANDTPRPPMKYLVMEFDHAGLTGVRKAAAGELADLEAEEPSINSLLSDYISENGGKTTATVAAEALGLNRSHISTALNKGHEFVKLKKVGKSQFFGVKTHAAS